MEKGFNWHTSTKPGTNSFVSRSNIEVPAIHVSVMTDSPGVGKPKRAWEDNMDTQNEVNEVVGEEVQQGITEDQKRKFYDAIESNKHEDVKSLLTQEIYKGWLRLVELPDLCWLSDCYVKVMTDDAAVAKVVRNLTGIKEHKKFIKESSQYTRSDEKWRPFLPYVGKVIFKLLGSNYRILYQEEIFCQENCEQYCQLSLGNHLLFLAVLTNKKEMAEVFWRLSNSKIGMALVVCKMFKNLSKAAESIRELNLEKTMEENAESFGTLARKVLDHIYEADRFGAYKHIGAKVEFDLGEYLTPMSIAYDAGAQEFLEHSCCQTLLKMIWMNAINTDTPFHRFLPILSPFSLLWMTFKQDLFRYSSMKNNPSNSDDSKHQNAGEATDKSSTGKDYFYQVDSLGKFRWFCIKMFFTAPVNKFAYSFISYVSFLGILTHFVLTELKPLDSVQDISVSEWLIYIWMFAFFFQESKQVRDIKTSGPLYKLKKKGNMWSKVWSWHERLRFNFIVYRMLTFFSDIWNFMDCLMLLLFVVTAVVRFTIEKNDFAVVRILFCIFILLCYLRILRFGYIRKELGPRIAIMTTLLKDLFFFMLIMMVFIISFGVAFQAFISPNTESSWRLLGNVLWRGYWQMLGEIFVDEVHEGMGLETTPRNCTTDHEHCYDWFLPILLGLFMMITNILLLNLLIAAFSRSFEKAEEESLKFWYYHLYGLYVEYYLQAWVVVPFNPLWYLGKKIYDKVASKYCSKSAKEFADNLFCLDESFRHDKMENCAVDKVVEEEAEEMQRKIMPLGNMFLASQKNSADLSEKILQIEKDLTKLTEYIEGKK